MSDLNLQMSKFIRLATKIPPPPENPTLRNESATGVTKNSATRLGQYLRTQEDWSRLTRECEINMCIYYRVAENLSPEQRGWKTRPKEASGGSWVS